MSRESAIPCSRLRSKNSSRSTRFGCCSTLKRFDWPDSVPGPNGAPEEINDEIEQARDPDSVIDLDDSWHLELVADCPNKVLIDLIKQFIRRTRRYEVALMRERENVLVTVADHEAVMAALHGRDLDAACAALRVNLQSGRMPIVQWLTEREGNRAPEKERP